MSQEHVKKPNQPSLFHAVFSISILIGLIFSGLFILKTSLHTMMLLNIFWVAINAYYLDSDIVRLKKSMTTAIQKSASVLLIFILIGAVIAAFTLSGAIPTLIYYGLDFISPQAFLPIGLILCSIMSLAIGSSWGAIGTMGVALIGVANILHIPLPIAAGMIVSGAYFGDKFSPISDTTILSALTTETDLYKHIKGMTYSVIPAYIITLGIFWTISGHYAMPNGDYIENLRSVQHLITNHFHVGLITLLPMAVMLVLSVKKKPAEISMLSAVIVAILLAVAVQKFNLSSIFDSIYSGPNIKEPSSQILTEVLSRGGIQSMLWSMSLTLLILTLGGLLEAYHFISVLFISLIKHIKRPVSLVFTTLLTSVLSNMLMGEAYLSIILVSRTFKKAYENLGLDSCVFSKSIEEGATFSTPLIPWTTSGVFVFTTLGVYPMDYLFWSLFNWIAPAAFLGFVAINFAGVKMFNKELGHAR